MDRFMLEEKIMESWQTSNDLDSIIERIDELSEDEIANVLIGLKVLHDIRSKKLFETYEGLISKL